MKFRQFKSALFALSGALLLTSCGPVVQLFDVDVKIPAKYPIELANKSLAVFSNIGKGNDSLLMVNLAAGISASLEKRLSYEEGGVPVFNLLPDSSAVRDIYYIQSLSQKSNADVLIILEGLKVGMPQYNSSYVIVPFSSVMNIYDGITAETLAAVNQTDTVYWEVLSRNDLLSSEFTARLYKSIDEISKGLGSSIVANFFDNWDSVERYLYLFNEPRWSQSCQLASDFKWSEASEIWMEEASSNDKLRSACAAFNLAVACEMSSNKGLALKWIDYAKSRYPLTGIENYESLLRK